MTPLLGRKRTHVVGLVGDEKRGKYNNSLPPNSVRPDDELLQHRVMMICRTYRGQENIGEV